MKFNLGTVLLLAITTLVSCKMDNASETKPGPARGTIGGMEEPTSPMFTFAELQIGRNICANLNTKRSMLEVLRQDQSKKLVFRGNAQACGASVPHIVNNDFGAYVTLVATDYEFVSPNRSEYFRDIVTDQSGVMKEVCEELAVSSNSIKRQIPITNSNFIIKFLVKDSYDRVEITQYSPNSKGGYVLNNVEGISFVTTVKQGPKEYLGLEKERSRYTLCPSQKQTSYLIQTWMRDATTL